MQIDRESLDKLLTLNDRQLTTVIQRLLNESGIDPAALPVNTESVESIRQALRTATDEDLRRIAELYEANKGKLPPKGNRGRRG